MCVARHVESRIKISYRTVPVSSSFKTCSSSSEPTSSQFQRRNSKTQRSRSNRRRQKSKRNNLHQQHLQDQLNQNHQIYPLGSSGVNQLTSAQDQQIHQKAHQNLEPGHNTEEVQSCIAATRYPLNQYIEMPVPRYNSVQSENENLQCF